MAKNAETDLQIERHRLAKTIEIAKEQIAYLEKRKIDNKEEVAALRADMRDNTEHSIGNLWGSEGFEALAELSQYTNMLNDKIIDYDEMEHKISRLKQLLQAPYFARIDFKFDEETEFEEIYIGKTALKQEGGINRYVYDWRSPVASVFYRFLYGKVYYDAPIGQITGEMNRKRQYEISAGKLQYFFDAEIQVVDEFLKKILAKNTSPKMQSIVETIQREQDLVIRDIKSDLMVVQGVAGSGKTSIALHRVAYLMYEGLATHLAAEDIMIISPNSFFEHYIDNVLPELGEEHVISETWDALCALVMRRKNLQSKEQFQESVIADNPHAAIIQQSITFKTSQEFLHLLEKVVDTLPKKKKGSDGTIDVKHIYARLLNDWQYFSYLSQGIKLPVNIVDIIRWSRENLENRKLYYEDAAALMYLQIRLNKIKTYQGMKQVVIDEAQDYYPLHFAVCNLLFPNAKFTILGDVKQTIEKQEDLRFYHQLGDLLGKKQMCMIALHKSFRCTSEILKFGLQFLENSEQVESFNRSGAMPRVAAFEKADVFYRSLIEEIKSCQENHYPMIGLICKTRKNAQATFERLKDLIDIQLILDSKSTPKQTGKGVLIMPVYMAKGLEFDAVIICDANRENYHTQADKRLLYIASTRALHRLTVFCQGELADFFSK